MVTKGRKEHQRRRGGTGRAAWRSRAAPTYRSCPATRHWACVSCVVCRVCIVCACACVCRVAYLWERERLRFSHGGSTTTSPKPPATSASSSSSCSRCPAAQRAPRALVVRTYVRGGAAAEGGDDTVPASRGPLTCWMSLCTPPPERSTPPIRPSSGEDYRERSGGGGVP
jgi:hypothetical protein